MFDPQHLAIPIGFHFLYVDDVCTSQENVQNSTALSSFKYTLQYLITSLAHILFRYR
jgi:hypothetical protein